MTLRELIHSLKSLVTSFFDFIASLWNNILDTPLSTYGDILFWIFVAGAVACVLLMLCEFIKGILGKGPGSTWAYKDNIGHRFGSWLRSEFRRNLLK